MAICRNTATKFAALMCLHQDTSVGLLILNADNGDVDDYMFLSGDITKVQVADPNYNNLPLPSSPQDIQMEDTYG